MGDQSDILTGWGFLDWLEKLGIVPPEVRRVIIDARFDGPVVIYVEKLGTTKLIQFEPPDISQARVHIIED